MAARCEMLEAFEVDWPWIVLMRVDDVLRAAAIADAPARHRVRLRHAVDGHRAAIELRVRLREARERLGRPVDVLVHLIRGDHDVRVLVEHSAERLQFGSRVGGAGRVARAVQDEQLGAGRDAAA